MKVIHVDDPQHIYYRSIPEECVMCDRKQREVKRLKSGKFICRHCWNKYIRSS